MYWQIICTSLTRGFLMLQSRAQAATELLQELNSDVCGNFVEEVITPHFSKHSYNWLNIRSKSQIGSKVNQTKSEVKSDVKNWINFKVTVNSILLTGRTVSLVMVYTAYKGIDRPAVIPLIVTKIPLVFASPAESRQAPGQRSRVFPQVLPGHRCPVTRKVRSYSYS